MMVVGAFGAGCGLGDEPGSGVFMQQERETSSFQTLEVSGFFDQVNVSICEDCTEPSAVTISGDDNIVPQVEVVNAGDRLILRVEGDYQPNNPLQLQLETPAFERIEVYDSAYVILGTLESEALTVRLNDSSALELVGGVATLDVEARDSSNLAARDFQATDATISTTGSAEVTVCVSGLLDATIKDSASILYYCEPAEITEDVSMSGTLGEGG